MRLVASARTSRSSAGAPSPTIDELGEVADEMGEEELCRQLSNDFVPYRFVQSISMPEIALKLLAEEGESARRQETESRQLRRADSGSGLAHASSDPAETREEGHAAQVDASWFRAVVDANRRRKAVLLAVLVITAGCATIVPFEMLNTRDRGCGDLISLMEYAWAAAVSAPGLGKAKIPWKYHGGILLCAVGYSSLCNQALALALPMPVFLGKTRSMIPSCVSAQRSCPAKRLPLTTARRGCSAEEWHAGCEHAGRDGALRPPLFAGPGRSRHHSLCRPGGNDIC